MKSHSIRFGRIRGIGHDTGDAAQRVRSAICKPSGVKSYRLQRVRSNSETSGFLSRLHLVASEPARIGKEVDGLVRATGARSNGTNQRSTWTAITKSSKKAIRIVGALPRAEAKHLLGASVRRSQDIVHGRSKPRARLRDLLLALGAKLGLNAPKASTYFCFHR